MEGILTERGREFEAKNKVFEFFLYISNEMKAKSIMNEKPFNKQGEKDYGEKTKQASRGTEKGPSGVARDKRGVGGAGRA
jgi:hypothetical protein